MLGMVKELFNRPGAIVTGVALFVGRILETSGQELLNELGPASHDDWRAGHTRPNFLLFSIFSCASCKEAAGVHQ